MKKRYLALLGIIVSIGISYYSLTQPFNSNVSQTDSVALTIVVPTERYPETAAHIKSAEEHGKTNICTIDRKGAEENRKESLKGIPTKKGFDRDEFPMAMCAEGGTGADIMYVTPEDNRGAGSWISNQLEKYPEGTRVKIFAK